MAFKSMARICDYENNIYDIATFLILRGIYNESICHEMKNMRLPVFINTSREMKSIELQEFISLSHLYIT